MSTLQAPFYDFHVHSCLSPCADDGATPQMLAGFGKLAGLSLMALTDHNTAKNCPAFFAACDAYGVVPIAGMELTCAEEVHMVCLFETLDGAQEFERCLEPLRMPVKNRPEIFGNQLLADADGVICGQESTLLGAATALPLEKAPALVARCGGICYPAHIDRQSGGILAILGDFPAELPVLFYELGQAQKKEALQAAHAALRGKTRLYGSDAHHTDAFLRQSTERLPLRLDAAQEAPQQRAALFAWLRGEKH